MNSLFVDIWTWLVAVVVEWYSIAVGGFVFGLLALLEQALGRKVLAPRSFIVALCVAFLVANFLAYEHKDRRVTPTFTFVPPVPAFAGIVNHEANVTERYEIPGDTPETLGWAERVVVAPVYQGDSQYRNGKEIERLRALVKDDIQSDSFALTTKRIDPSSIGGSYAHGAHSEMLTAAEEYRLEHTINGNYVDGIYYVIDVVVTRRPNPDALIIEDCAIVTKGSMPRLCASVEGTKGK